MWNFGFSAGWSTDVALHSWTTGLQVPTFIIIVYNFTNFTTTFSEMTKKLILSEQLFYNWNIAIVTII